MSVPLIPAETVKRLFGPRPGRGAAGVAGLCLLAASLVAAVVWVAALGDEPPRDDSEAASSQPKALAVHVDDGITVELLGLSFHPSEGKEWWNADGAVLQRQPVAEIDGSVRLYHERLEDCREFLLRIRGLPREHAVRVETGRGSSGGSTWQDGVWTARHAAGPFDGATMKLRLGWTTEELGPPLIIDANGRRGSLADIPDDLKPLYVQFRTLRVETTDQPELVCEPTQALSELASWQLVAVDKSGEAHRNNSMGGFQDRVAFGFRIDRDELDHFEFRLRPYEHWVAFDDVSLVPGQMTAAKVTIETDVPPQERTVSLRAEDMPLREALAEVCRQAHLSLHVDEEALVAKGLDFDDRVTVWIEEESLNEAVARLIQSMENWQRGGVYQEVRGNTLTISTLAARAAERERVRELLPDWLRPHGGEVDEDGNVVRVSIGRATTDDLLGQLATLPELRELNISSTSEVTPAGLAHLGQMTALEKLSLFDVNVDGNGLGDAAMGAVAGLRQLVDLSINECGTTDAGVRLLEGMPQLTRLELRQEGRLTDTALASIGQLTGLKHLRLNSYVGTEHYGRMRFNEEGVRQLAGLQELEELHLVGHAVPAEAIVFDRLTSLSLGGPAVDDACAARIATCRRLEALSLSYTSITDAGLQQVATLPVLSRLDLDSHLVTDDGIAHLMALPNLQHLSMRASRVTDESLALLAEIKTLTRLDLHGSGHPGVVLGERFTVEGLARLKALPKLRVLRLTNLRSASGYLDLQELAQLRWLSLDMCDIRPDQIAALEDAMPDTTIRAKSGGGLIRRPR